ncbi:Uncharacterized protein Rs2_29085 [Raphanus sativus]|nr:Uncharacterized protein Rs2_29085 [Raphanus sativus]
MSSSQDGKKNSDVEMTEAPPAPSVEPTPEPSCVAGFLSFRDTMARRKAEKEIIRGVDESPSSPAAVDTPASGSEVPIFPEVGEHPEMPSPGVLTQASGSLLVLIVVDDKEEAIGPVPPVKKEIVLALRAGSAAPRKGTSSRF